MNYERVMLEALNRINALEERVAVLEDTNIHKKQTYAKELPTPSKKYRLLSDYLHNSEEIRVSLTFDDIERLLGFKLPPSARKHMAFWANTTSHSIALSWLGVGYEIVEADMKNEVVIFEQKRQYGKVNRA